MTVLPTKCVLLIVLYGVSFGSTQSTAPTFGSSQSTAPTFASTQSTAPTFGSTQSTAPTFGSTQSTAPSDPSFDFGKQKAQLISNLLMQHPHLAEQIWKIGFTVMLNSIGHKHDDFDKNTTKMFLDYALDNLPTVLNNNNFQNMVRDSGDEFAAAYNRSIASGNKEWVGGQDGNGVDSLTKEDIMNVVKHLDFSSLVQKMLRNGKPMLDSLMSQDTEMFLPFVTKAVNVTEMIVKNPSFKAVKDIFVSELMTGYKAMLNDRNKNSTTVHMNATDMIIDIIKHTNKQKLLTEALNAGKPFIDTVIGKDASEILTGIGLLATVYPTLSSNAQFKRFKSIATKHFLETMHRLNISMDQLKLNSSQVIHQVVSNTNKLQIVQDLIPANIAQNVHRLTEEDDVNDKCYSDSMDALDALLNKKLWAIKMFDSFGKLSGGVLRGHLNMVGSYDECKSIQAYTPAGSIIGNRTKETATSFRARFCRISVKVPQHVIDMDDSKGLKLKLTWGICVPDSCHSKDVQSIFKMKTFEKFAPVLDGMSVNCTEELLLSEDTSAITAISVLTFFALVVLIGSIVEFIWSERKKWHKSYDLEKVDDVSPPKNIDIEKKGDVTPVEESDQTDTINVPFDVNQDITDNQNNTTTDCQDNTSPVRIMENGDEKKENGFDPQFIDTNRTYFQKGVLPENKQTEGDRNDGILVRILTAFAIQVNTKRIVSGKVGESMIGCVNGIRFFSISWIIVGHTFNYGIFTVPDLWTTDNAVYADTILKRFISQAPLGAALAVDSFYMISGMLVIYLKLDYVKKLMKSRTWLKIADFVSKYIIHRFWRLTPMYMITIMVLGCLMKYFGEGPFWPAVVTTAENCKTNWWTNMLYVNNFLPGDQQCMTWSWFLANDMQFYILTLLFLPLLAIHLTIGLIAIVLLMLSGISAAAISEHKYGGDILHVKGDHNSYWDHVYVPPWCRVSAYCVGMILGVLMAERPKKQLNRIHTIVGWTVSICLALFIVYIPYTEHREGGKPWSIDTKTIYESIGRPLWSACVAWVVFACHNGSGGYVNKLLSWPGLIPLSRLCFAAYLLHPIVMMTFMYSKRSLFYLSDYEIVYLVIGHTVLTFMVSFLASAVFEYPSLALQKIIFR